MATGRPSPGRRRSGGGSGGSKSSSNGSASKQQDFDDYSIIDPSEIPDGPDVVLDIPVVKVDEISLEVEDLRAQVAVLAEVRDMVQIGIGADVSLGKVELKIEGVEAQALLKARLDNVHRILARVFTTLDRNPELLRSLGRTVEHVGQGAQQTLEGAGSAVEDVGGGAQSAVQDVGKGANQAVGQIGQGAGQGVGQVGQGAGQAVQQVGQGANQALGEVGEGASQGVQGVGQGARQATQQLAGQGK